MLSTFLAFVTIKAQDTLHDTTWQKAVNGDAQSQCTIGDRFFWGDKNTPKDLQQAFVWYEKAANAGFTRALKQLGYMYYSGVGVTESKTTSAVWYREAAEQGDAYSQYWLGVMSENGYGVKSDNAEAAKWYRKAAEQGQVKAQMNIGYLYLYGKGVQKDLRIARMWYEKAAAQGNEEATQMLHQVDYQLSYEKP